ncbi:hypothetical protein LTR17_007139 [Elasticomyces elasticus]|nr:hypothetical protein LTR17_007139 [Elasticomyces elasticus]
MSHKDRTVSPPASTRQGPSSEKDKPFHENFQNTETPNDIPPSVIATPDEVRDFITRLLINRRGLPQDHVRRAVAKWTVGSGRELRSYSPSMYLDLFGREDGWIIYHEVKLCIYYEQNKSGGRFDKYITAALVALLEMVFVSVACSTVSVGLSASAIMASIFGGLTCIYACIHCLPRKPESLVEAELRACTKNTTTAPV